MADISREIAEAIRKTAVDNCEGRVPSTNSMEQIIRATLEEREGLLRHALSCMDRNCKRCLAELERK